MAACISVAANGTLKLDTVTPVSDCVYVLVQSSEFTTISGLNALFAEYFAFDLTISELVGTAYMVSFISGHVLGRVISGLRKAGLKSGFSAPVKSANSRR